MATWPSISKPSALVEHTEKGQLRSDFSAGYVQSRPKWTRARKRFDLTWEALETSEKDTLETFFEQNIGNTFDWVHPLTGQTYTVRFYDDSLAFTYVYFDRWRVSLILEEQ